MLLNKHERKAKDALQADRKSWELYGRKMSLGWTKLDKPLQRGYKQYFVLRDDIKRHPDAKYISDILRLINNTTYASSQTFSYHKGNKKIEYNAPQLRHVTKEEYEKLSPRHQKYLTRVNVGGWALCCQVWGVHYHFKTPWMFETVIEPHIITHVREFDQQLEKEIGEHDKLMSDRQYFRVLAKIKGYRYNYDGGYSFTHLPSKYKLDRQNHYRKEIDKALEGVD